MLDPLLLVELVPLLLSGALAVAAGIHTWLRAPRTPLTVTLTLLLVFLGHLSLAGALLALPNDPGLAIRLFPLFQLAVTGCVLAFLVFLIAPHLDARRVDGLLSSIAFSGLVFVALVIWRPAFYWGTTTPGPLYALDGIRAAGFALAAWLLASRGLLTTRRFAHVPRQSALLLSAGFLFMAVHSAVTATMRSLLAGRPTPEAGFLALPFILGLFVHLVVVSRGRHRLPAARALRFLLAALVPALASVIVLDLLVLQVLPASAAALVLDVVLAHFWMSALAITTIWSTRPRRGRDTRRGTDAQPTGRPMQSA